MGRPKGSVSSAPKGGVLLIQHMLDGRALVVGSREIKKRLSDHRQALKHHQHWNHQLQRDFDADPLAYKFVVVEDGLYSAIVIREAKRAHIKRLQTKGLAYNLKGAGSKKSKVVDPPLVPGGREIAMGCTPTLPDLLARLEQWGNAWRSR